MCTLLKQIHFDLIHFNETPVSIDFVTAPIIQLPSFQARAQPLTHAPPHPLTDKYPTTHTHTHTHTHRGTHAKASNHLCVELYQFWAVSAHAEGWGNSSPHHQSLDLVLRVSVMMVRVRVCFYIYDHVFVSMCVCMCLYANVHLYAQCILYVCMHVLVCIYLHTRSTTFVISSTHTPSTLIHPLDPHNLAMLSVSATRSLARVGLQSWR